MSLVGHLSARLRHGAHFIARLYLCIQSFEGRAHSFALHTALSAIEAQMLVFFAILRVTACVPRVSYRFQHACTYENGPPHRLARILPPSRFYSRRDGPESGRPTRTRTEEGPDSKIDRLSPSLFLLFLSTLSLSLPPSASRQDFT